MAAFKFRAAAALDWRRRQEDAAAGRLSESEAHLRGATEARDDAERARGEAGRAAEEGARRGIDGTTLGWHRNWIASCIAVVAARTRDVERRTAETVDARRAWYEARRRRLALERLRERALARFEQEQDRLEMKMLDEVARLRFLARAEAREGDDTL
jgi:flagellar export protein FliJ